MVQWLRLHVPNAGDPGSNPGQGTRSCVLKLKRTAVKEMNILKKYSDFSGGPVVKNLLANVGHKDLITDPGGFHMLRGK